MSKILIWGTGEQAKLIMKEECCKECEILGFIDSYKSKETFYGFPVILPKQIETVNFDYIVISNEMAEEILKICQEKSIPDEKIVVVHNYRQKYVKIHEQNEELLKESMPSLYKKIIALKKMESNCRIIYPCGYDRVDEKMLLGKERFQGQYLKDYVRHRCLELAAREIKEIETEENWSVAELGVFRGAFSAMINAVFPDKQLYMFDTFEGFDDAEAKREIEKGYCDEEFVETFKDTDAEMVLKNMPYRQNCVIRKGLFPDTSKGLEQIKWGFVSIDVDFEKSIYAGLEFFYPRMIKGGVIFIHDYNFSILQGVRQAVKQYEKDYGVYLHKLPLPDNCGTLAILC